jgi:type IV pilus assembly protein PilV
MNDGHRNLKRRAAIGGQADRGFVLIEALVALLIFSFGVLGIVGLQASMTKAQSQSKFRADASLLAQQAIGAMWSDTANLASYATASCTGHARCNDWKTRVAAVLPNATPTITFLSANEVQVTITWAPPHEETHTYTTTSAIAVNPP